MPGVFLDYPAPVIRNADAERKLILMRWGMPPPPRTGGPPETDIHNASSPHWRGWLEHESRRLVPFKARVLTCLIASGAQVPSIR